MAAKKGFHPLLAVVIVLVLLPVLWLFWQIASGDFLSLDKDDRPMPREEDFRHEPPSPRNDDVSIPYEVIRDDSPRERVQEAVTVTPIIDGIQARVIDAYTKKPIPRFTFYYCPASMDNLELAIQANTAQSKIFGRPDGIIRIYDLEEGEYIVGVQARGYPLFIKAGMKIPQKKDLEVLEVPRGTFIEGKVMNHDGRPLSGMLVHLVVEELANPFDQPPATRVSKSDHEGIFLFSGLPPGRYGLKLQSLRDPMDEVRDIILGQGGSARFNLAMPRLNTMEFIITDVFGNNLPNARVTLHEGTKSVHFAGKTNRLGKVTFNFVPEGDYTLRIFKSNYRSIEEEGFKILPGSDIIRITRALDK